MQRMAPISTIGLISAAMMCHGGALGQVMEEKIVVAAASVLNEALATPLNKIPQSMLANSYGVAIIPNVIKGGFIVGARHGRGLLFVREPEGVWHAPVFITLTGGNIGWQAGVQSSDIVLVFKTPKSVQGILSGKLTVGADAAAAAGPVGRQGAVATDGRLQAEIYSYSRSRGLFAGVSVDGSVLQIDQLSTGAYYRSPGPGQPVVVPPSAQALTQAIAAYASAQATETNTPDTKPNQLRSDLAQRYTASEADILRAQLVQNAPALFDLLDDQWRAYLALPQSLLPGGPHPSPDELNSAIEHFNFVDRDPRFQQLAARPEFQSVRGLLLHYRQVLEPKSAILQLPAPPAKNDVLPP